MDRRLRGLALIGFTALVPAAVMLVPMHAVEAPASETVPLAVRAATGSPYDLAMLRVVHLAMQPVAESYVEPDRIDPQRMYEAALESVERLVPAVSFHLEDRQLAIHVADVRTVRDVPPITTIAGMESELRKVAALLATHLGPDDVPHDHLDMAPLSAIEFAMVNGMLATLDPHSALLPPAETRELDAENQGEFGGLGVSLSVDDDGLRVDDTVKDCPAATAGVRPGDHIRRIDGQSTINVSLDDAVDLLRGPIGESVMLEIMRAGLSKPLFVPVVRGKIRIHEVAAWPLAGGLAYARVTAFHATVHDDLVAELRRVERAEGEIRGLVLDLRGNPGGYVNQAVAVADAFLKEGEIVSTRGPHDTRPDSHSATDDGTEWTFPMVVLVDAESASASEIVAGALRNNERAVIVGERTFGKGSVQNLEPMPFDSELKVTVAQYLTPGDRSIQNVGIPADVEVVPTWVGRRDQEGLLIPDAAVLVGERAERESDLDEHLDRRDARELDPALYSYRAWNPWGRAVDLDAPPEPGTDEDLRLALDLLAVAPTAHRGDMLAAAGPVVKRHELAGERAITEAFRGIGVDWTGPSDGAPAAVEVSMSTPGDALVAGEDAPVTVTVTNRGATPLRRLLVVMHGEETFDGLEFPIGKLEPGASGTWTRTVRAPEGWPAEAGSVRLDVRDDQGHALGSSITAVTLKPRQLPRLAWRWTLVPEVNHQLAVGDLARVELEIKNVGEGASLGATVRIRNRSAGALDIVTGTLHGGRLIDARGRPCALVTPGWENGGPVGHAAPTDPRYLERVPPVWAPKCHREINPGESWTGSFEVRILEPAIDDVYKLDLTVADDITYDYPSIVRQGFYDWHESEEAILFHLGQAPPTVTFREPPSIVLTEEPAPQTDGGAVRIAGRVLDADGLGDVMVFADQDKVFFERHGRAKPQDVVPFSAEVRFEAGTHVLSVLARDNAGFNTTLSRLVWRPEDDWQALANPARHP